ncbi:MAG: zinc ribbon domain-containing protein [Phycisphaerae bacterium]|nr:zinc ribbon domain-containing protein [Phycisphaerae bacterium]
MPVFEYRCRKCGHDFEELVRRAGESVPCPECGAKDVERRLSVFAARQGPAASAPAKIGGACGRCGDPNGPCGF